MEKHSSSNILIAFAYFKKIELLFLMSSFLYSLSLSLFLLPSLHKFLQENVHPHSSSRREGKYICIWFLCSPNWFALQFSRQLVK